MSSPVSTLAGSGVAGSTNPRQHLTERQAQTVERLTEAAVAELRERGYDGLTVRNVAARAGVASATAYNYFTSKDHLITEVFWRRLAALPETRHDGRRAARTRLHAALADIALLVADEPELAAACSVAMLGSDPDVRRLCDRIGLEMRRRVADALGPDADPAVLRALDLVITGALVHAGMGHLAYTDLPDLLAQVSTTILQGAS